jgi:hypothetical protein
MCVTLNESILFSPNDISARHQCAGRVQRYFARRSRLLAVGTSLGLYCVMLIAPAINTTDSMKEVSGSRNQCGLRVEWRHIAWAYLTNEYLSSAGTATAIPSARLTTKETTMLLGRSRPERTKSDIARHHVYTRRIETHIENIIRYSNAIQAACC